MQDAETILSVYRDRGTRGLPLKRVYRQLFNRNLYLLAYGRIYRNDGAMTPGADEETVDGMSQEKINQIIEMMRSETYRWSPARRVMIAKKNSTQKRPLGLPTWSDKLVQEVIRLLLDAYFEPLFSPYSHGFRPGRGCHTALSEIRKTWRGMGWFIEGDISACFESLDHEIMLSILAEHIHDERFLRLVRNLLKAGYLENWKYGASYSGTPQGGVVSPILSNIYLDRLDKFVETTLIPAYNRGTERRKSRSYNQINNRIHYLKRIGRQDETEKLRELRRQMPSRDPNDPSYRRLRYVRYADDFLLGFCGPRREALEIKQQLKEYLSDELKLKLSENKTLITHARSSAARFLGYEISVFHDNHVVDKHGQRNINGVIRLHIPGDIVKGKCRRYMRHGKPIHLPERTPNSEFSLVTEFQAEYRGFVEYYRMAHNLHRLNYLYWVMSMSLAKTLAAKLRLSVREVFRRYKTSVQTPGGPRKVLRVVINREDGKPPLVAQWGGISLQRRMNVTLNDMPAKVWNARTEILERLLADTCELCGSKENVQVHHVRHLKDLQTEGQTPKPYWMRMMAARRRKTLVVCELCHNAIHAGRNPAVETTGL